MIQPINPPKEWDKDRILEYLSRLHDDLYPKVQAWVPVASGVTGEMTAGYVRQGGLIVVSVVFTGPTTCVNGEVSLPFITSGDYVLSVQAGALLLPASVQKSTSTLELPDWNEAGNVTISGVIAV